VRDRNIGLIKAVYQNVILKSKRLKQVKTNLWAYSEDGGPLTDNVVLTAISGSLFIGLKRIFLSGLSEPVLEEKDAETSSDEFAG